MSYLVDTHVLLELRKGRQCDPRVASWFSRVSAEELYLSALTVGEIRTGIENVRRRDERRAAALEAWLSELEANHAGRIIPIDLAVAEQWGRSNGPEPLPVIEGLLAATAAVHGLTLVTRKVEHVSG